MFRNDMLNLIKQKFTDKSQLIMVNQFRIFCEIENIDYSSSRKYNLGDEVVLKKGTLLHGTYKNLEGLKYIATAGLISSDFIDSRKSKYPACVSVWKLKEDYKLKDYINLYSGATVKYSGLLVDNEYSQKIKTDIISYDDLFQINEILRQNPCRIWNMEQTKEARFLPSLVQDKVQIGIIFKNNNDVNRLVENGDILDVSVVDDFSVKEFVNSDYYERFINDRKIKDDFFTDRESAILYGIPSNCIEGILVGRTYEKDSEKLKKIKEILPNVYICNLDGCVIVEN